MNFPHVGFTGTGRAPLPPKQKETLDRVLRALREWWGANTLHHGDCVHADQEAATVAARLGYWVIGHVPEETKHRGFFHSDEDREPKPYLTRNQDIVNECDILVATPKEEKEVLRSGTWSTIRMARRAGRPYIIIWPNGTALDTTDLTVHI